MNIFRRIINKLRLGFVWLSASVAFAMMLVVIIDVVLRTISGHGISGSVQMVELGMLMVVFLALAETQSIGDHVSVDLLANRLPARTQHVLEFLMLFIYLFFCAVATYYTFASAMESMVNREVMWMGVEVIPQWPFRFIIPCGLMLLNLELVYEMIQFIRKTNTTKREE